MARREWLNTDVFNPVVVAALTPKKNASMAATFFAGYMMIMPMMLRPTIYASEKRRASAITLDNGSIWRARSHNAI